MSEKGKTRIESLQRPRSSSLVSVGLTSARKPSGTALAVKSRSSIARASGRKSQVKKVSEGKPPSGPSKVFVDRHEGLDMSSDESEKSDSRPTSPTAKHTARKPPTGLSPSFISSSSVRKSSMGMSKSHTTSTLTAATKADSHISRNKGNIRKSFSHKVHVTVDKPPSGSHATSRKVSKSKTTAEVQVRASVRFSRTSSSGTIRKVSVVGGGSPSHVPLGKRPTPPPSVPVTSQGSPVHRSLRRGSSVEREEAFSAFDHISLLATDTM